MDYITQLGENAKKAKAAIANANTSDKDHILMTIAANLRQNADIILEENKKI